MLTLVMIAVWAGLGLIGSLLLWHAIKNDNLLADREVNEDDVSGGGE